jgi:hypothetical protein
VASARAKPRWREYVPGRGAFRTTYSRVIVAKRRGRSIVGGKGWRFVLALGCSRRRVELRDESGIGRGAMMRRIPQR